MAQQAHLGDATLRHSLRARAAIAEADTIIGYVTHTRLIADLIDGKQVIKKSMTEELDHVVEALELAQQGRKVALVSSGDAGVYGMAGPTPAALIYRAFWANQNICPAPLATLPEVAQRHARATGPARHQRRRRAGGKSLSQKKADRFSRSVFASLRGSTY